MAERPRPTAKPASDPDPSLASLPFDWPLLPLLELPGADEVGRAAYRFVAGRRRRGRPVHEFVVEKWRWRFGEQPDDPQHGELVAWYRHRF